MIPESTWDGDDATREAEPESDFEKLEDSHQSEEETRSCKSFESAGHDYMAYVKRADVQANGKLLASAPGSESQLRAVLSVVLLRLSADHELLCRNDLGDL